MKLAPPSSRRLFESLAAVVLVLASAACDAPSPDPGAETEPLFDPVAEEQVILALQRQWMQRLMADDVDWIVDLHTADAWQLPPGAEPVVGHEALRAAWERLALTEGLEIIWEPALARVSESGDLAYDLGSATVTNPDGSSVPAKYLVVWVREGGRWKVAAETLSRNGVEESKSRRVEE